MYRQLICFAVGLLISGTFLSTSSRADDEVQALRAELAQMRAEYEARVQKLETRISELATAQEEASRATENAVQLATTNRKLLTEYATTPRYDAIQEPLEAAKGFEFHGYLRSGFGLNERGDKPQTFKAPFSLGRYRLGNEPDTYAELIFVQNWLNPNREKGKAWFKTEVMIQARLLHLM